MSTLNYVMATVANCDPGFLNQALVHTGNVAEQLKDQAGASFTRYGVIATGDQAGCILLFQGYSELNGVDAAFNVYSGSDDYAALVGSGKISIALRNIIKIEGLGLQNTSTEVPAYGVLTRWGSADLMTERMAPLVPLFEDNGAMSLRYGTIMTGIAAGRRLLGVGYPSMDAIEKTYEALRGSQGYSDVLNDIDLDFRNIVRYVG